MQKELLVSAGLKLIKVFLICAQLEPQDVCIAVEQLSKWMGIKSLVVGVEGEREARRKV